MATIFVVEDDPELRGLYKRILEARQYSVKCVADGDEFFALISDMTPDLTILDVSLNSSIDGYDIARKLRSDSRFSNLPILIASGRDDEEAIKKGIDSGADDYLLKPLRLNEVYAKIDMLIKKKPTMNQGLQPGIKFAERYNIVKTIEHGGESTVYLATDTHQTPPVEVALKILKQQDDSDDSVSRFLSEAYGLSKLAHENIVKLLDFGNYKKINYIVTEFIDGVSLKTMIKESPVSEKFAILLALEIGKTFKYMSEFDIVHRDIKPDNILVSNGNKITLVDFGVSKNKNHRTASLKNEMYGTPQFISPDYIKSSNNLDIKSDIYSLAVTLFFAVSGELPFNGDDSMTLMYKQLYDSPPALSSITNEVSKEFEEIINSMLEKDPVKRCNVNEMIKQFEELMLKYES